MTFTIPVWALWLGVPVAILALGVLGFMAYVGYEFISAITRWRN